MAWEKKEKEIASIFEVEKTSLDEEQKGVEHWRCIRDDNPIEVTGLKSKYFTTPVFKYDAEVINVSQPGVLMSNNQNPPITNDFMQYLESLADHAEPEKIANFNFDIVDRIEKFYLDDIRENWLKIAVFFEEKIFRLEIKLENYTALGKEIRRRYPQCYIFNDDAFDRTASEIYGRACMNLRTTQMYYFGGWHKVGNQLKFLHGGIVK